MWVFLDCCFLCACLHYPTLINSTKTKYRRTRTIRTVTSFSTTPRGGTTPPPRRAQPLLLLFRSNPPTEGGAKKGAPNLRASRPFRRALLSARGGLFIPFLDPIPPNEGRARKGCYPFWTEIKRAARIDELNGHPPGSDGPMVTALRRYNGGRVLVFVVGAFAEM